MDVVERRQPQPGAGPVELHTPELQPLADRSLGMAPEDPADGGARHARAQRVDREAGARLGEDVGDKRGARDAHQLGGERGAEREDVATTTSGCSSRTSGSVSGVAWTTAS